MQTIRGKSIPAAGRGRGSATPSRSGHKMRVRACESGESGAPNEPGEVCRAGKHRVQSWDFVSGARWDL